MTKRNRQQQNNAKRLGQASCHRRDVDAIMTNPTALATTFRDLSPQYIRYLPMPSGETSDGLCDNQTR
jgi:hypothetical protein